MDNYFQEFSRKSRLAINRILRALLPLMVLVLAVSGYARPASGQVPSSWIKSTFHGDGLTVSFDHPKSWQSQLGPNSFHYYDTFAYLSNFTLHQFCEEHEPPGSGFTCWWKDVGAFAPRGVLMTFGTGGFGPGGAESHAQLLDGGARVKIGGRLARRTVGVGQGCLGTGAQSSLSYVILDGKSQGAFDVEFCFRGPQVSKLRTEAEQVAKTIRLHPGPSGVGAQLS
jgi:hypothetical protein